MTASNYIRFFDTTLRDGEQSPGATLTSQEKLEIARQLTRLGVDIIESGFAAASPDDLKAIQMISRDSGTLEGIAQWTDEALTPPTICSLSRAHERDIDKAWEAVQYAEKPRIHTFIATSPIHMEYKLQMDPEEVIDRAVKMVKHAKSMCKDIEFSPEDAGRSDPEFLYLILGEVIKAGATTLNIPDTVGYRTPEEFGALIRGIKENTPGIENAIISTHCHDDLGLATANTLAGVQNGARQVEVTINGIGERAGNTSLEEVVMALRTRKPFYDMEYGIVTEQIMRTSRMVSQYTSMVVPPNKAIVGANAFAHEAGIHQDGMLKNEETYEIMRPESVGLTESNLVLGKHSGRHALKMRLEELGFTVGDDKLKEVFARFKRLADKKKTVTDLDLEALVVEEKQRPTEIFSLKDIQVVSGTLGMPTATIRLEGPDGTMHVNAAMGTGPVDAAYKAIDQVVALPIELLEYTVNGVTEGIDALGEVTVRIDVDATQVASSIPQKMSPQSGAKTNLTFNGFSAHTDIIVASARAYVVALNKALAALGLYGIEKPAEKETA